MSHNIFPFWNDRNLNSPKTSGQQHCCYYYYWHLSIGAIVKCFWHWGTNQSPLKQTHLCCRVSKPLIVFNWSTIRLRSGPPLENIVWIIMVYRASNNPYPSTPLSTPPFSGIRYLQSQLHGTKCTISPICPSSHALLYFFPSHSVGPSKEANLLPTCLLHRVGSTGNKQTKTKNHQQNNTNPIRCWKRLRCSNVPCNLHGLADASFSSTCVCRRELQSCLGWRAKVSAAHWTSAEDNAPILPLPLWNKPIISPIVCSQQWAA